LGQDGRVDSSARPGHLGDVVDTKRRLADRRWRDMNYYAEAKSPVITAIMERAEAWAARENWELD
jgi:GrpB-like predicted nucleotidyltransferase (UPF0157 family)